jgi:heme exporter protein CcmD
MMEVLAMGGYGNFVWGAYGLTVIVLAICIVGGRVRHTKTINDVRRRIRAMEAKS